MRPFPHLRILATAAAWGVLAYLLRHPLQIPCPVALALLVIIATTTGAVITQAEDYSQGPTHRLVAVPAWILLCGWSTVGLVLLLEIIAGPALPLETPSPQGATLATTTAAAIIGLLAYSPTLRHHHARDKIQGTLKTPLQIAAGVVLGLAAARALGLY